MQDSVNSIASSYWAAHFGCEREELFSKPLRIAVHGCELANYNGVFALFRYGAVIVSVPAHHAESLRPRLSALPNGCSPDALAAILKPVATAIIGLAYIGYSSDIASPIHPTRALEFEDAAALHLLERSCDGVEWEHGGSTIECPSSGVFVDGKLVAVAGYEIWGGTIAHISVVTHPRYRGRGFGRSAVAHLAARIVSVGLLPQYRTLESNRASLRIAESLGFRLYARSLAIRLGDRI